MPGMRRGDRRDANDDNARRNLPSPQHEPTSIEELRQRLLEARAERIRTETERDQIKSELEEKTKILGDKSSQLVHVQQAFQVSQQEVDTWMEKSNQNYQLYLEEQRKYQQTLVLYDQERARVNEWATKYAEVEAQNKQYLELYNEAQADLKSERRSKAGIKGWETRRKKENQKLKQEIGELTILVRESLSRKDEALKNLSLFADRMDKIQGLVNSIEGESSDNPIGLLQKFKRIWISIKDILSE